MRNRTLVLAGLLACASCAGGEELDLSSLHPTSGSSGTGGQGGTSGSGTTGGNNATSGSGGNSGGQSGSNGQSGSVGSGGAAQSDASAGGAGHGGVGGSSGAGGASGSGGSGGSAVSDAGFVAGFSGLYRAADSHATTNYVQVELEIKNGSSTSVPKGELKIRYYFTDDGHKAPTITINWGHVTTTMGDAQIAMSALTSVVSPVVPATASADSYIEFGFAGGQPDVAPSQSIAFSWRMNGSNQGTDVFTQSNDYSFDAAKASERATWDHIVILRNGTVVWGTPP